MYFFTYFRILFFFSRHAERIHPAAANSKNNTILVVTNERSCKGNKKHGNRPLAVIRRWPNCKSGKLLCVSCCLFFEYVCTVFHVFLEVIVGEQDVEKIKNLFDDVDFIEYHFILYYCRKCTRVTIILF